VSFDRYGVTSDIWEPYPILRFSEVSAVDVQLLPGNGNPALGVGETAQGPTVAGIGNAVYDALGARVRTLPFTGENIVAALGLTGHYLHLAAEAAGESLRNHQVRRVQLRN
jgi:nicotinate dehydrogenase subunit B